MWTVDDEVAEVCFSVQPGCKGIYLLVMLLTHSFEFYNIYKVVTAFDSKRFNDIKQCLTLGDGVGSAVM